LSLILALLALDDEQATKDAFVAGVGALLRARTVVYGTGGDELGTFSENTRPTYDEVLELADIAARDIDTEIGPDVVAFPRPEIVKPLADSLLKLRTAMLVELSYFPEQVATGRSAYAQYERMYDRRLPALIKAAEQTGAGDEPGSVDDALMPVFSFPPAPCDPGELPV
jgi:hypothetical protein